VAEGREERGWQRGGRKEGGRGEGGKRIEKSFRCSKLGELAG
jgi:hypothetical protein